MQLIVRAFSSKSSVDIPQKYPKKNPAKCTNLIIKKRCGMFWQPIVSLIHVAMGSRNLGQRCHDVTTKPHDLTIYSWFFVDDHPYTGTMSSLWIWQDQKEGPVHLGPEMGASCWACDIACCWESSGTSKSNMSKLAPIDWKSYKMIFPNLKYLCKPIRFCQYNSNPF